MAHREEVEIRSGPWTESPQQVICEYVAPVANGSGEAWELADWVRLTVHFPLFMLCDNALACIFHRCTMCVVSLHRGKEFVEFCLTLTALIGDPIDLSYNSHRLNPTCVVIVLDARRAIDQPSSN